jgi:hypothetical protein
LKKLIYCEHSMRTRSQFVGMYLQREMVREMGNVANINCPVCHGVDITKAWVIGTGYYECNSCGARFKV